MSNLVIAQQSNSQLAAFDRHAAIQVAVEKRNTLIEFVRAVMTQGVDYGKVPGTDKDTLFKPGAEKLCTLFNYVPVYETVEKTEDWTGVNHNGEPFFFYHYRCKIEDQSGRVIAAGEGSVNSWEKKYRYRDAKPICPHCGQPTVNKSKDSGWYCWKKIGGCGATFQDGDPAIVSQPIGKVPNPDIFDQVNTMMKMGQKRALVGAVLLACNASEFFTQDLEDLAVIDAEVVTTARQSQATHQAGLWLTERLTRIMDRTELGMDDLAKIADKKKIDLSAPTSAQLEYVRDASYAAAKSQVFPSAKAAWDAYRAMHREEDWNDETLWQAWEREAQSFFDAQSEPVTAEVVEEEF